MCGRSRCAAAPRAVARVFGVPQDKWRDADKFKPSNNVCPGKYTPVLYLSKDGEKKVRSMRWGLVPSYTKKDEQPNFWRMFNARSETVDKLTTFKRLVNRKRCVVFMDGFYEWKSRVEGVDPRTQKTVKQPYYVQFNGKDHMLMAGLYDVWENEEGEVVFSYTILTTRASESLRWLHSRMPVLLTEETMDAWISDSPLSEILRTHDKLLEPFGKKGDIKAHPVDRKMTQISYDEDDACAPIDLEEQARAAKAAFEKRSITRFFSASPVKPVKPKVEEGAKANKRKPDTDETKSDAPSQIPDSAESGSAASAKHDVVDLCEDESREAAVLSDPKSPAKRPSDCEPASAQPPKKRQRTGAAETKSKPRASGGKAKAKARPKGDILSFFARKK